MVVKDRLYRIGGILYRNRNILPFVFIISQIIAFFFATPFRIWNGVGCTILSCTLTFLGLILCALSSEATGDQDKFSNNGIYSVIRYPNYLGWAMIMLGITIYAGIGWFVPIYIGMVIWVLDRLLLFEDGVMEKRFETNFNEWAARTNALRIPVRRFSFKISLTRMSKVVKCDAVLWLAVSCCYLFIGVIKNFAVYFTFDISLFWLVLTLALMVVAIFSRIAKRRDKVNNAI